MKTTRAFPTLSPGRHSPWTYDDDMVAAIDREMGWSESRHFTPAVWSTIRDTDRLIAIMRRTSDAVRVIAPGEFPAPPRKVRLLDRLLFRNRKEEK